MTILSNLLGAVSPIGATGPRGATGVGATGLTGATGATGAGASGIGGATGAGGGPLISSIAIADATYTVLDDTSANTGGGYIVITGTNFVSGATVLIDTTTAPSVTFVDSTTLRAQVPAKAAASYNVWVINPNGGTAIKVNGLSYSTTPTWVTTSPLANVASNVAFSVAFSATGANTYSVAAGSTLPAGTTLAANGYFSGTVSIATETNYSFTIRATDTELQDADKTFAVTVTVPPPTYGTLWSWGSNGEGRLGINDSSIVARSTPGQLGSTSNWNLVSLSEKSASAIKTDGTLWLWGRNNYGQLGFGDTANKSSPTQLGALTNWSTISAQIYGFAALKTNGTIWLWGKNNYGTLGDGTVIDRNSPVQIGSGTTWNRIVSNGAGVTTIAVKQP